MPTEFYLKFRTLLLTEKNTITFLYSHRSTQQRQVRLKSVLFGVRIRNSPLHPLNSCFNIVHSLNVLQQTQVQMNVDQISGPVFSKPVFVSCCV